MTSSGTYNYSLSNGGIMRTSFGRVRVRTPSIRTEHLITAQDEMNLLFVEASNKQVNLWKVDQVIVPLIGGQSTYAVDAKTIMVLDAWIRTTAGGATNDRYITPMSRTEYASLSNKQTPGAPTSFWFDRLINPQLLLWPVPEQTGTYSLVYFRVSQMQDVALAGGQTPDLPYRWLDWMVAGLSHRLSRHYAPDLEAIRENDANKAWRIAAAQDVEDSNISISPPIGLYYR